MKVVATENIPKLDCADTWASSASDRSGGGLITVSSFLVFGEEYPSKFANTEFRNLTVMVSTKSYTYKSSNLPC